jgi:uncharacterized protein
MMSPMVLPVLAAAELWYKDGLRFACTACGNCCTGGPGYVWITGEEVQRLACHLHLPLEETVRRHCRNVAGRLSLRETVRDGLHDCVFLRIETPRGVDRNGRPDAPSAGPRRVCSIYPVRPLQCRTWPFWDGNLASQENWDRAAERCPGIHRGRLRSPAEIEALRDAEDWPKEKQP